MKHRKYLIIIFLSTLALMVVYFGTTYAKYVYKVIHLENFRKILFCVEKRYPHFINKKDELRTKNTLKFQVHQIILYLLLAGSKKQKEKHYRISFSRGA